MKLIDLDKCVINALELFIKNKPKLSLPKFKRPTLRLTLVKDYNMKNPEGYAELIKIAKPKFIECKSFMWVGHSKERLEIENMPLHLDIKEFAKKIEKLTNYKIKDEKELA